MEIIDEIIIEGHNANPDQAERIIKEGLEKIENLECVLVLAVNAF